LIKRRHSSILDVSSSRAANWDPSHCLVVARVREILALSNKNAHILCGDIQSQEVK
jgi:hypothetical protein